MSFRPTLSLLAVLALCACDNLGIGGAPDELTMEVESVGASQVTLVTSTKWISELDPACDPNAPGGCPQVLRVLDADTATVTAPHRQTLRFTTDYRYLVEAFPAGGATATVTMKIDIDGKEWFNEGRQLSPTGQKSLQFVYQWQEPTIR